MERVLVGVLVVLAAATASAKPSYVAFFDGLVRQIEQAHVFPPAYERVVGHPWKTDVPILRAEMAKATTRTEALVALYHLQRSLHDLHCRPDAPADVEPAPLQLGVTLWSGGTLAAPDVRIATLRDPSLSASLSPGDAVVAVDGMPLAAWLAAHPFESSALEPARMLNDTANAIATQWTPWTTTKPGDTRQLTVVHAGEKRDVKLPFAAQWPRSAPQLDPDRPPPMASVDCDPDAPPGYGPYRLSAVGVNVCVYQPQAGARPGVPIVRYLSFLYGANADAAQVFRFLKIDHDLLQRELRGAQGVIVDLHDNHGGNLPYLFISWFAQSAFGHEYLATRVLPGPLGDEIAAQNLGHPEKRKAYAAAQAAKQPWLFSRFFCTGERCDDDRVPESERVIRAPVAVIVGPGCISSCDTFATAWSHWKLGPVLGKQPMHAYTVHRVSIPMRVGSEDLGRFWLGVSSSELSRGTPLEGEPLRLDWTAPHDFAQRDSWIADAIRQAAILLPGPTGRK
jgi:hypothetical protein